MLGGTQDEGTILCKSPPKWDEARHGDGYYSLIAPSDPTVMFSQHQRLHDTQRRVGTGGWVGIFAGTNVPNTVSENACIAVHPLDANILIANGGDQVYATTTALSTAQWSPQGPTQLAAWERITRVAFQPGTHAWMAGSSGVALWYRAAPTSSSTWEKIDVKRPEPAYVKDMAYAPTNPMVLYVAYQGGHHTRRVLRLEQKPPPVGGWNATWITANLPVERKILSICGDGHEDDVAYVGTDRGVWRWDAASTGPGSWRPYNNGLPLVWVYDLLVPAGRTDGVSPGSVPPSQMELIAATHGRGVWSVMTGP